jgi:tRNA(fMet)-specific endonuclease VapC
VFLLDTDHLVVLERGESPASEILASRISLHSPADLFVSIVSFHEQVAGWQAYLGRKRSSVQVVRAYREFGRLLDAFSTAQIAQYNDAAATRFEELRRARVRIGTMDLRIAAIALTRDFTVLTRNLIDFEKVPELRVEDWTVALPDKPR